MQRALRRSTVMIAVVVIAVVPSTHAPAASAVPPPVRQSSDRQIAAAQQAIPPIGGNVPAVQFDPALALLPSGALRTVNFAQASVNRAYAGKRRALTRQSSLAAPTAYTEHEPANTTGGNDTSRTAEHIAKFGVGQGSNPKAAISGTLAPDPSIVVLPPAAEDNGSIPRAADTGVAAARKGMRTTGVIGDGPHGSSGDKHGDVDFYKVTAVPAGVPLGIDIQASAGLNAVVRIFDAAGNGLLYIDDPTSPNIQFNAPLPAADVYYVMVSGFGASFPTDPYDPASGTGTGSEGPYQLTLSLGTTGDVDVYSFDLRAGDVVGATIKGSGRYLSFLDPAGTLLEGSPVDASGAYAPASPLPGGGNATADLVAPRAGRYALSVSAGTGPYTVTLEGYRPGTETQPRGTVQTIFLDFDGARVNTSIFGAGGAQRDLSPLSSFLAGWGLTAADGNRVIDAAVRRFKENVAQHIRAAGTNPDFAVRILDSRHDRDPFGQPNVSRVIIGGSIAESGIPTIGISQSIDPGNFGHEETALVLLDELSAPTGPPDSLTTYMAAGSNRIAFVGQAIGNLAAHEAGHFSGNWHTNQFDDTADIMDQGGNPAQMFGVGPDGIGGTADDSNVAFTSDQLDPDEPFAGTEDTLNRMAWAYRRGQS